MMSELNPTRDISHIWTRVHRHWLLTGLLAGIGAGFLTLLLASLVAFQMGQEVTYPAKIIGAALLGASATEMGTIGAGTFAGLFIHFGLSSFFGLVFAQFVSEFSRKRILILLGVLASLAVWLFWFMMFMPSFNEPMAVLVPKGFSLFLHLGFGFSFGVLLSGLRSLICKD